MIGPPPERKADIILGSIQRMLENFAHSGKMPTPEDVARASIAAHLMWKEYCRMARIPYVESPTDVAVLPAPGSCCDHAH